MPWTDETGTPVTDPMILQSLGMPQAAPSATPQATGHWEDEAGKPVTDPMILKSLGTADQSNGQMTGMGRYPAMIGSNLLKGAMTVAEIPGDVAQLTLYPFKKIANYLTDSNQPTPLIPSGLMQATNALGLTNRPDLTPQNAPEQYTAAISSGVGGTVPFGLGGGLSQLGKTAAIGAGAGIGNQAATNNFPNNPYAPVIGTLAGSLMGAGLGSGADALLAKATGIDTALANTEDIRARILNGEGRLGEFHKQGQDAFASLQQATADMPQVAADKNIPMAATARVLNSPSGSMIPGADKLAAVVNPTGFLPYGELENLKNQFSDSPTIYQALKADQRAALIAQHGADAGAAFDKANLASQAIRALGKGTDQYGIYNPLLLNRAMARLPNGDNIADVTPEMSQLVDNGSKLAFAVSQIAKENAPGIPFINKLGRMGAGLALGQAIGNEGLSGALAGALMEQQPKAGMSLLYGLPKNYGAMFAGSPTTLATMNALRMQGLLAPQGP